MSVRRGLIGHAIALALAAAAAWWVYSGVPEKPQSGVVILDWGVQELSELSFQIKASRRLSLRRMESLDGFWLVVEGEKPPLKKTEPETHVADEKPESYRSAYRASREFEKGMEKLLPLRAERKLGQVDAARLSEYGLDKPRGHLRLLAEGKQVVFRIGRRSYGGATAYLQHEETAEVFLFSSAVLNLLDFRAPRFMERRVLDLAPAELDRIEVLCGPRGARKLVRKASQGAPDGRWVAADDPEAKADQIDAWVRQVSRMRGLEYLNEKVQPEPKSFCTLRLSRGDELVEELQFTWDAMSEKKNQAKARSRFTGAWVRLDPFHAKNFITDIQRVLSSD